MDDKIKDSDTPGNKGKLTRKHVGLLLLPLLIFALAVLIYGIKAHNEAGAVPAAQPDILPRLDEPRLETVEGVVRSGDTAQTLLAPYLSVTEIAEVAAQTRKVFSPRDIRAGQPFRVTLRAGELTEFEYKISSEENLVVRKDNTTYSVERKQLPIETSTMLVNGRIETNLFESMTAAGEKPELAIKLADIFAWDIDFCRDVQPGDSYVVLVEKKTHEGQLIGYGRILAAQFVNDGSKYQAFTYRYKGNDGYYDQAGNAIRKAFLRAPLSFTRISSGYTFKRFHPILNYSRPHLGIDYAAPTGTPVWSVGEGTITKVGYNGEAGKFVRIRHSGGFETQYNHLSGYSKGARSGAKVSQGQVIGYVGMTGLATGPHLDFRMYQNGKPLNAMKLKTKPAEPLPASVMADFKEHSAKLAAVLSGETKLAGL